MAPRPVVTTSDWYNTSSDEEDYPTVLSTPSTGRCTPSTCQHFTEEVARVLRYPSSRDEPYERAHSRQIHAARQELLILVIFDTQRPSPWYHPALLLHAIELFPFVASYVRTIRIDTLVVDWANCPPPRRNIVSARTFTRHLLDATDMSAYLDRLGLGVEVDRAARVRLNNFLMTKQNCRDSWEDSLREQSPMCPLIILLFLCPRLSSLGIVDASQQEQFATLLGCLDAQVIQDAKYWDDAGPQTAVSAPGRPRMAPPAVRRLGMGQLYGTTRTQLERIGDVETRLTTGRAMVFLALPQLRGVELCFLTGSVPQRQYPAMHAVTSLMIRGTCCSYKTIAELSVLCTRLTSLVVMFSFSTEQGCLGVEIPMLNIALREYAIDRGADPARFAGRCLHRVTPGQRYQMEDYGEVWQECWEWRFRVISTTATATATATATEEDN